MAITTTTSTLHTFLRRLQHTSASNSTQHLPLLTLLISTAIFLLLATLTLTATLIGLVFFVLGLIVFVPFIILFSPIWLPIFVCVFVPLLGFVSLCGFGFVALAALWWVYRYCRGMHPPGSDRFDYARNSIANTARGARDYAREYGGYLHSKVKDAAPGA
ncbi:oleosin G-like [Amaranthus tricolor]|uniref:oleosin G-like n=1 Tax=Amaranthus tricolor TaxID=29722 RepID=UPI00258C07B8|nr:oleosin G-like [Amaranthus tricolor]